MPQTQKEVQLKGSNQKLGHHEYHICNFNARKHFPPNQTSEPCQNLWYRTDVKLHPQLNPNAGWFECNSRVLLGGDN